VDHLTLRLLDRAVVSELTGVPIRTLKQWERRGLVGRVPRGTHARYSWKDVEEVQTLAALLAGRRLPLREARRLLSTGAGGRGPLRTVRASRPRAAAARPGPGGSRRSRRRHAREGVPGPRGHDPR
jgi:DNA-binding transcriptional MerR regulator